MIRGRLAVISALTFLTWLGGGYQFGLWPQLFPLEHILHLDGALRGDWYTSHAAPHWVFDHAFALLPPGALAPSFLMLWLAGMLLFWSAFVGLAGDLGLDGLATLGAGWIGARTAFAGLGASALLTPYLYPSSLAAVPWMFAMRAALRSRVILTGVLIGATLILHPQVGLLAAPIAIVVLAGVAGWRRGLVAAGVALVSGGWALARLIGDLVGRGDIAQPDRFALLALVRLPHHLVYGAFPAWEYVMIAAWALVLVASFGRLRPRPPGWRTWALATGAICAVGAAASWLGRPVSLVELQTARASDAIPLMAALLSAAALARGGTRGAGVVLLSIPVAASLLWIPLGPLLRSGPLHGLPGQVVQAPLLFLAVATFGGARPIPSFSRSVRAVAWLLIPIALAISGWRRPPHPEIEASWRDIAERATAVSRPTDVFLTPPDLDGFRFYSRRPIVVDFGNIAHDDLLEWRDRMIAVTGDSTVLRPRPLEPVSRRLERIARDYDAYVSKAKDVARRLDAHFVVVRRANQEAAPEWLRLIDANPVYALYAVRPAARADR